MTEEQLPQLVEGAPEDVPRRFTMLQRENDLRNHNMRVAMARMYRDGDPLAIDGFYLACREAWDAIWTCPGSADLLAEAGEEYARDLEGLLATARRHGGGLHAKMMATRSGTRLWDSICYKPFAEVQLPGRLRGRLQASFFFEAVPQVRRVVFIATPHGGSSWATRAVGKLTSSWTVTVSLTMSFRMAARPSRRITSIDMLSAVFTMPVPSQVGSSLPMQPMPA